jgi:eukaryotic translation initiation factor 2C
MAGPAKNRNLQQKQQKQQQQQAARSSDNSWSSRDPTQRSINKFDGNKDPHGHGAGVMEYTRPNDLKNLSEFLGMAGWAAARGVSANAPISAYICMHARSCLPCILTMQTLSSRAPASHGMDA